MAKTYKVQPKFTGAGRFVTGETFSSDDVGTFDQGKTIHPDHLAHWLNIGAVAEETAEERKAREADASAQGGAAGAEAKARATKGDLAPDSPALTTGSAGGAPLDTSAAATPGPTETATGSK